MAVYDALQPLSQVADLPDYMKPTWFRKKNGQNSMFGDIFNVAVPALATIGGALIGGPMGASLGSTVGQAAVGAVNRDQSKKARLDGSTLAQNQIDNDLAPDMARAGLASSLAGMVNISPGKGATTTTGTPTVQSVNPSADNSGLGAGAMQATGMTDYNQAKANLVNQFTSPPTSTQPGTPMKISLNPTDADLPGMVQNAVTGFSRRPKKMGSFGTSYQQFADGGLLTQPGPKKPTYEEWLKSLPANLRNTDTRQYNMRGAFEGGLKPELNEDGSYHLGSRNPMTGEILKTPAHPTWDKMVQGESEAGYQLYQLKDKFFSLPKDKPLPKGAVPYANQQFAEGGLAQPLAPLPIRDNAAARQARFGRMLNNRIDDGVEPVLAVSTEASQANVAGTGFVKNWLTSRGYGQYADNLPAPTILPEQQFKQRFGFNAGGANELQDDGSTVSYLRDGMNTDLLRTAAVEETTHAAQRSMANVPEVQQSMDLIASRIKPGLDPETQAYLGDPREAGARLMRMRETNNQDPNKRFNRLGWMFKTLFKKPDEFKDLKKVMSRGDIFRSLNDTFAEGGTPKTDNYKRYLSTDKKTEDLWLVNKKTGKLHGAMRFGERIYDQEATDHIDSTVKTLKLTPSADGFYQLGKFIFDETLTHKDHQQQFAGGGKPTPVINQVRQLQQLLAYNGHYKGEINGKMDADTKDAVYAYNRTIKNDDSAKILIGGDNSDELIRLPINEAPDFDPNSMGSFVFEKFNKKPAAAGAAAPTATTVAQSASVAVPKTKEPVGSPYNPLSPGNVADAVRTFVGYSQANRDLPENPINRDYLKLVGDAKVKAGQGLGPASRQLFNTQIDDSRSLGIEAIRRSAGGGGSGGAVLAALGNVNDATTNAALKLAAADEQANAYNQQRYQNLLGGQIEQEQQRFGMAYNAALANKQAGINLAQQGLQSIQNRYDTWNLYDNPKSSLARFAAMQQANQAKAASNTDRNYANIGRLLTNQTQ